MHVLHFSWKTKYRPISWSWGYCNSCQQHGPVRLESVVEVLYLNGIVRLGERSKGQMARCDFCRRGVAMVEDRPGINLADWSPRDGLLSLLTKLGIPVPSSLPQMSSDERMHSLLSSIQQSSSASRVELGCLGISTGLVVGALAPNLLGKRLLENRIVQPPRDELGFLFMLSFAGMFLGVLLGALIEFLLRRDRSAVARIREAFVNYSIDPYRLEELSQAYKKTVQKAVKTVCRDAPREP